MAKIVTKDVVIRRIIGAGVCAAISVAAYVIFGDLNSKAHKSWAVITFLGAAFLAICYIIGILIAWS